MAHGVSLHPHVKARTSKTDPIGIANEQWVNMASRMAYLMIALLLVAQPANRISATEGERRVVRFRIMTRST